MNKQSVVSLTIGACLTLGILTGCVSREMHSTYEVSEMGNNAVQNTTVEEYVGPDHKRVINKQIVRENIRCVGPNGKTIRVNTIQECIKQKGRVVDEVYQEEKVTKRR